MYQKRFSCYLLFVLIFCTNSFAQDVVTATRIRPAQEDRKPNVKAKLLRGPYLQAATSNSIIIRWRTDGLTRGVVNFGEKQSELSIKAEDSTLNFDHIVKLTNLKPRTKYFYGVGGGLGDTLQNGSENYFVTMPLSGTEGAYRIGVFGDCGNGSENQLQVRNSVVNYLGNDKKMDSWILLGDNAYSSGTDPEFQEKFFNVYKDAFLTKYPLFPAPGNHDYNDFYRFKSTAQATHDVAYYKIFSMPQSGEAGGVASNTAAYYSYDVGNIHFLSLDSYGKEDNTTRMYDTSGAQVQWIKKDLEAFKNKKRGWVIAYWHHPPYTMGSHNSDKEMELVKIRENFIQVLERYGVDLILCGHSHLYERSKLMKGHYGMEETFDSSKHVINHSTALYNGSTNSCPYIKTADNTKGTVYVVTGSAGASGKPKETYPHNAMYYSNYSVGGASMIEVEGNRLDLKWICADGEIRDHFVMMKDVNKTTIVQAKKGKKIVLTADYIGNYEWSEKKQKTKSISISPSKNTTIKVKDPYSCVEEIFEIKIS